MTIGKSPQRQAVAYGGYDLGMDLEEDDAFLQAPSRSSSSLPEQPPELSVDNDDLEEDEAFMQPSSQPDIPNVPSNNLIEEELEEDMAFLRDPPVPSTSASPSSCRQRSASAQLPEEAPRIYGNVNQQTIDVSEVDLGRKQSFDRALGGTSYDGRKISFKRKKGNMMIGEVSQNLLRDQPS